MIKDKVNKCMDDIENFFDKIKTKQLVQPKDKDEKQIIHESFDVDVEIGLSSDQVLERQKRHETNKIKNTTDKTYFQIICNNVFTFYNILMIGIAFALFIFVGPEVILNMSFLIILFFNLCIGTFQECKSKATIQKLKLMNSGKITVKRDGTEQEILPIDIVLDDIIVLSIGDQIPADCIILSDGIVEVNESMLTGESKPVKKTKDEPIYAGSYIVSGRCVARAKYVGKDTYIYSIESKAKNFKKPKSKLMIHINRIIKTLASVAIPLAIIIFWNELLDSSTNFKNAILYGGTTVVYMIPAGLVLITSVAMATGVIKLASKKTLMQDLYSVEALSRVNTLCLDKTGTLTDGTMVVDEVYRIDYDFDLDILMSSYLNSFTTHNQTSKALCKKYNMKSFYSPKKVLEFSSDRKYSAVQFATNEIYALGAPEYLTKNSDILSRAKASASKGLRVILLASCKKISDDSVVPDKPLALFMIRDNIRAEIVDTMTWFRKNDVDIKVISGDNLDTVSYIAKHSGILNWDKCVDMSTVDIKDLEHLVLECSVFGRTTPEQKAEIIDILKKHGRTVAFCGDGINDIISLKKADCSIALANGAPATKNISNIVLLDSNFNNLQSAVLEGRRIINNIQRSASLFIMKDMCWFFISVLPLLMGIPHLLEPTVMTIVNTVITGIGSFMLALEPDSSRVQGSFVKNVLSKSISAGFFMFIPILFIFIYSFFRCGIHDIDAVQDFITTNMVPVISICVTISGLVIFWNLCQPFTKYRKILFTVILLGVILLLTAIPEFFLINGTSFMNQLISECGSISAIINRLWHMLFSFEIYSGFTIEQILIIVIFLFVSMVLYYISDRLIMKFLNITMFSRRTFDDEEE